jgi:hypothetical protein
MNAPKLRNVETGTGIVELEVIPAWCQVEIYSYTRHYKGDHIRPWDEKVYTEHIGKRYRLRGYLKKGSSRWDVVDQYFRNQKHNYFKFAIRNTVTSELSEMSGFTIKTVRRVDFESVHSKIYVV